MKRLLIASVCALALSAVAGVANATFFQWGGTLTGGAESPPTGSAGIGTALVTLDTSTQILTVNVTFSGLTGTTTASHIHCCTPSGNVAVATALPSFPGFPTGVMSGTYFNTFDMTLAASYNPAFVSANGNTIPLAEQALINGLNSQQAYLNIHSSTSPGGEIRTFLAPVPEPATWAMLIVGFGMVGLGLRQRRKVLAAA